MTQQPIVPTVAPSLPAYAMPGDAGADLCAAESVTLAPGRRATVDTATRIALPDGFAGFVVPRSGLAARHGITVLNSPGTVDSGYRGPIKVTLLNTDPTEPYEIEPGDRIAQLVVVAVQQVEFRSVIDLDDTERGEGGFGSTGYASRERIGEA